MYTRWKNPPCLRSAVYLTERHNNSTTLANASLQYHTTLYAGSSRADSSRSADYITSSAILWLLISLHIRIATALRSCGSSTLLQPIATSFLYRLCRIKCRIIVNTAKVPKTALVSASLRPDWFGVNCITFTILVYGIRRLVHYESTSTDGQTGDGRADRHAQTEVCVVHLSKASCPRSSKELGFVAVFQLYRKQP